MPLRKISDKTEGWIGTKTRCQSPEHLPPMHIVLQPGLYEYECPSCGFITYMTIPEYVLGDSLEYQRLDLNTKESPFWM